MNRSLEELNDMCWNAPDEYRDFLRHLNHSITMLNSVDGEFAVITKTNPQGIVEVEVDESRRDERLPYFWRTRSGREFAWVPLRFFP